MYFKREYIYVLSFSDGTLYEASSKQALARLVEATKETHIGETLELSQYTNKFLESDYILIQQFITFDQRITADQFNIDIL